MASTMRLLLVFACLWAFGACRRDAVVIDQSASGYPADVGKILLTKCAVPGCHSKQSAINAGGLDLSSWSAMLKGTNSGSAVIPYQPDFSTLFLFSNSYPTLGLSLLPRMPVNADPLSLEEVKTLRTWIANGAANASGTVPFSDKPWRTKYYVPNQGCDVVTVMDAATLVPMRNIPVGISPAIEAPHQVRISPDRRYWYVIFLAGRAFQKFDALTDELVGSIDLGEGSWNTFTLTPDGRHAFAVDWSSQGKIFYLNLENLTIETRYPLGLFKFPHGGSISPDGRFLIVPAQYGNYVYKIQIGSPFSPTNPNFDNIEVSLDGLPVNNQQGLNPHDLAFSPDGSRYFVSCQGSAEIRVLRTSDDALLQVLPTGFFPQEVVIYPGRNQLWVTCMGDSLSFSGKVGSVMAFDVNTGHRLATLFSGWQPHGIGIDPLFDRVVVANRNATLQGPPPHHSSFCGGRNGYVTFVHPGTFEVQKRRVEVSVDPYFVGIR
jgi:DNA-binding beta-propeller fold protein YncE